jgi:hypothetical protein
MGGFTHRRESIHASNLAIKSAGRWFCEIDEPARVRQFTFASWAFAINARLIANRFFIGWA